MKRQINYVEHILLGDYPRRTLFSVFSPFISLLIISQLLSLLFHIFSATKQQIGFALQALMEVPEQYKIIVKLGLMNPQQGAKYYKKVIFLVMYKLAIFLLHIVLTYCPCHETIIVQYQTSGGGGSSCWQKENEVQLLLKFPFTRMCTYMETNKLYSDLID